MTQPLSRLHVTGYRSLRDVTLEPGPLTVLIGPNGSGKSNLLSFLRLVPLLRTQSLQRFVQLEGGASHLLHRGPKATPEIAFELGFGGEHTYSARLAYGAGDSLFFEEENASSGGVNLKIGSGHRESALLAHEGDPMRDIGRSVSRHLAGISFFHFHDTSLASALRTNARANDTGALRSDGSNLAAYLLALRRSREPDAAAAWRRINALVRQVAPFVKELAPTPVGAVDPTWRDDPDVDLGSGGVRLDWVDQQDDVFGPDQLSDGTLRFVALTTALAQPAKRVPAFVSIDEPELGLHPAALTLFMGLVRSVSSRSQVVLATQSPALLDLARPEEVVVTELVDGETRLRRLEPEALEGWLEDFTLAELYDRNVLGGRP